MSVSQHSFSLFLGPHSRFSLPMQRLLNRNDGTLAECLIEFPQPKFHGEYLANFLKRNQLMLGSNHLYENYVGGVLQRADTRHVILSFDAFFGSRASAFKGGVAYPALENRLNNLRMLLQGQAATIFFCLQPAHEFFAQELADLPPEKRTSVLQLRESGLSWVPFLNRVRETYPEAKVVVIDQTELGRQWAAVVQLFSRCPLALEFDGLDDFSVSELRQSGRDAYRDALKNIYRLSIREWLEVADEYYSQYGTRRLRSVKSGEIVWSEAEDERSWLQFDEDLEAMGTMNGVTLVAESLGRLR